MLRSDDDGAAGGSDAAGDKVCTVGAIGDEAEEAGCSGGEGATHDLANRDDGGGGVGQPAVHTGVHWMTCEA